MARWERPVVFYAPIPPAPSTVSPSKTKGHPPISPTSSSLFTPQSFPLPSSSQHLNTPPTPTPRSSIPTKKREREDMESMQSWVSDHKLTTVATLWASAIGISLVAAGRRAVPLKPSLRIIHARMYAQAATLAVIGGAATLHYLDLNNVLEDDGCDTVASIDAFDHVSDWF